MRTYVFEDTGEKLPYGGFVSSRVQQSRKAPLVVALHGVGASQESMVRANFRTVELAEKGGYVLVVPLGYNHSGPGQAVGVRPSCRARPARTPPWRFRNRTPPCPSPTARCRHR